MSARARHAPSRRRFLAALLRAGAVGAAAGCAPPAPRPTGPGAPEWVNDVHAQLSRTLVARVRQVDSVEAVAAAIREARESGLAISIAGGRHAMGGQAFGADTICLDTRPMARVLGFDPAEGVIDVEAGIQWPALIDYLLGAQAGRSPQWGIAQKQSGADRLSLGGALAANVHGRGLRLPPIVGDVESLVLVDASGTPRRVSRREDPELFRLAIGGYGLFGVVVSVRLRLAPRRKLRRVVEILDVEALPEAFARRIAAGSLFGDFQYATDPGSEDFLRRGVFSCYQPVDESTPLAEATPDLTAGEWTRLVYLAHVDKAAAFALYAAHYVATADQVYWSDLAQRSLYVDDYHRALDRQLGARARGTEMISEVYVPRAALASFMADVRADFRAHRVDVVYGTVRLVERDDETLLAWAREPWACVIFNLHVDHTEAGLARATDDFRRLIDHGLRRGGSYYLTYHRWATRAQVEAAHPRFVEFLRAKRRLDPEERFQSEWYRHYREMFAGRL